MRRDVSPLRRPMALVLGLLAPAACADQVTDVETDDPRSPVPLRSEIVLVPQVERTIVGAAGAYGVGEGCWLFDANGSRVYTEDAFEVGPQTNLGNTLVRCETEVDNSTGRTILFDSANTSGTTCFANGMESIKWRQVITPEGSARLVCTFPGY